MSLTNPLRVVQDQFSHDEKVRRIELVWFVPGLLTAAAIVWRDTHIQNAAVLLAATSILAGMTFSMTVTFWNKSLEARRNAALALQGDVLETIDRNLTHMVWTVTVGVASTGAFVLVAIFADPTDGAPTGVSALCGGLLMYLITLVGVALQRFSHAALQLR